MRYSAILALSAPLLALSKPMAHERLHKRDAITSTSTVWEEVTVTVDVTVTVYGPAPGADQAQIGIIDQQDKPSDNTCITTTTPHVDTNQKPAAPQPTPPPPEQPKQAISQANDGQVVAQPKKDEQKQAPPPQPAPAPAKVEPQPQTPPPQPPKKDESKPQGGSQGPGGGSCGEMGGKCMASDVTIYNDQGTGACGWSNDTNSQDFFALAHTQWDGFTNDAPGPHKNKWCGRMATISVNGKTVEGMVTDKCPGCDGWSIDLSQSLWNKIYNGEAPTRKHQVEWWFSGPQVYHGASG